MLNPQYDGYQRGLAIMVYKFFDKKTWSGTTSKARANVNEVPAQELLKTLIKKLKRRKLYLRFKDNIWAADLAELWSLSSFNSSGKYLLCLIDIFTKYVWVKPLTDKKAKTVLNGFIGIVNKSKCKPNKFSRI